jgi:hypothetical protein
VSVKVALKKVTPIKSWFLIRVRQICYETVPKNFHEAMRQRRNFGTWVGNSGLQSRYIHEFFFKTLKLLFTSQTQIDLNFFKIVAQIPLGHSNYCYQNKNVVDIIFDFFKKSQFDIYLDTLSDCEAYIITFSRSIATFSRFLKEVRSKKIMYGGRMVMIYSTRRVPDS